MDASAASRAIFRRWIAFWPAQSGGVEYSTDNNLKPEVVPHARVAIVSLDSEQYTLGPKGNRKWQRLGFIEVRLVDNLHTGRKLLDQLTGAVREIFEGVRFASGPGEDGIVTHASSVAELRREPDSDQLWLVTVTTPFEYYESR